MATLSIEHRGGSVYHVTVRDAGSQTNHDVTVWPSDVERYAPGSTPEALLEASFAFLLEREPKEAILSRFEVTDIERYFPEYRPCHAWRALTGIGHGLMTQERADRFLVLIVAAGVALQISWFLVSPSLWLDEAGVALNLLDRGFRGLTEPLVHHHAPLLFLWIEKLLLIALGPGDGILRLQSLVCGVLASVCFALLVRRRVAPATAVVAVVLFSFSPALVWLSAQVKPYAGDALVAVLLLLVGLRGHERRWRAVDLVTFAALGGISILYSFSSVLVMAGLGSYLIASAVLQNGKRAATALSCIALIWVVIFAAYYVFYLRHSTADANLSNYWGDRGFLEWPVSLYAARKNVEVISEGIANSLGLTYFALPVVLFVAGLLYAARENRQLTAITVLVVGCTLALAFGGLWPFNDRLVLFLSPLSAVAVAYGIVSMSKGQLGASQLAVAAVVLGLLVFNQATRLRDRFSMALRGPGLEDTLLQLKTAAGDDDLVYIYYFNGDAFQFYDRLHDFRFKHVVIGSWTGDDFGTFSKQINQLAEKYRRVWWVFAETDNLVLGKREFILLQLNERGRLRERLGSDGASGAYLYEF